MSYLIAHWKRVHSIGAPFAVASGLDVLFWLEERSERFQYVEEVRDERMDVSEHTDSLSMSSSPLPSTIILASLFLLLSSGNASGIADEKRG